ncbi:unnamed protein product [Rotaria sp. Silwood2]|nr:unnamed protein product [Rotaria sp. Silwood2]CAF4470520.1 unnamed protein product [Rotaria sp. Silwood2]
MIPSQNRLISHHEQQHLRTRSQEARQRRRQRQRRRRRERRAAPRRQQNQAHRQQQWQQHQPRQYHQQRQQHQPRQYHRQQQQQQQPRQQEQRRGGQRNDQWWGRQWQGGQQRGRERIHFNHTWRHSNLFDEGSVRDYQQRLLEDYEFETIDARQRWEQEQVNELEGFAVLEQLALIQDEIEQSHQIDTVQQLQEDEQQERNTEQLVHQELWEQIEFLHQQLNQR